MVTQEVIRQVKDGKKRKGITDIVFCIDISGSMTPVIEGLKSNIENFVDDLKTNNQQISDLDFRLGILAHWAGFGARDINFYKLDFTNDIKKFKDALITLSTGSDEITLPALDWSLDFDWRDATRIVIVFTDEELGTGWNPEIQRSKIKELEEKIGKLKVNLYFVGWDCAEYQNIVKYTPRANGTLVDDTSIFSSYNFDNLLATMAKTLSSSLGQQSGVSNVNKDIYNIQSNVKLQNL